VYTTYICYFTRTFIFYLTNNYVAYYNAAGVPSNEKDEFGLPLHFESEKIQVAGLIVAEYSAEYSHWSAVRSLGHWLQASGVPALTGVDTRALTQRLREQGAVVGKIEFDNDPIAFEDPNTRNLVAEVSCKTIRSFGPNDGVVILAFDCGIKYNIIRYFVHRHGVRLVVVPYDYPLKSNPDNICYKGIFLSNGPGDPSMCTDTIASLQWAIGRVDPVPIFGICLGNQLMAIACGAKTFKMKYGNRGMNQPCIDLRTAKCYITPQNHGYAVDNATLPADWKPLFLNANDQTNEGIIHNFKPFFSAQFHPEAQGGPTDTSFLFQTFLEMVSGLPAQRVLLDPGLYGNAVIRKVLLIGSGGLSIGQAGEFDYSGAQAIKALKEEGIEVILINPNIATVQTSKNLGRASPDKVYFLPIRASVVEEIIQKERPDGIIVSMGGQTALNVGIELYNAKVFEKYNCKVLGTPIETIVATEDRQIFSRKLAEIGESLALSYSASSVQQALEVALKIGYPVLVRATFALGGLGSGFADHPAQLKEQCEKAFAVSSQILIDQDLRGWKEIEYEVVRDCRDNCITVCNMENFDPLGVHTGDSIVIAPSQTLTNSEYFMLRHTSIKVIRSLGVVGECNIQFALDPLSERYCIIEVNARLSRSSALASKATGYPLAYVAAKLSLGKDLVSIRNSITKITTACFEPSLDFCCIKMPRWDLAKFNKVSTELGSSMSSVGEVMAIGRSFEEAIQKAVRMVTGGRLYGLDGHTNGIVYKANAPSVSDEDLDTLLRVPTDKRIYAIQTALERGYSVEKINSLSHIDKWFLSKLQNIANLKMEAKQCSLESLGTEAMRTLKSKGFSDRQIAAYVSSSELAVRSRRMLLHVLPVCKQIDTLAAEFPAQTNYCYMTYNGTCHDTAVSATATGGDTTASTFAGTAAGTAGGTAAGTNTDAGMDTGMHTTGAGAGAGAGAGVGSGGVMVLGCGAYSIGSSVEFDWCAVSAIRQLRAMGERVVVVNYNPETVSTDYDESDKLYFEEITLERILDIYELEHSRGVIVSVGGQIPNNLALYLHQQGVHILGTPADSIDKAEDRHKFSSMLDSLKVDQPVWSELTSHAEALRFADRVGYPVLVRPSFVLSGAAMSVASDAQALVACMQDAEEVSSDKPVVLSKFYLNCKEIEFDAVSRDGIILNYAISEHIENAGVHSGDATLVLPAQRLYVQTVRAVKNVASLISKALRISGPFNIQFLAKDNMVKVIECNLRASRTFPFVSKTFDVNFISLATKVMMGVPCKPFNISLLDYDYVAVKAPMFSFTRLRGADPTLGVEMSSTGEVACFGRNVQEAFLQVSDRMIG
jgi:carbamoyl-phosphate synthase small subunit